MMHRLFATGTNLFGEHRLVHFAGVDTPKGPESKLPTIDTAEQKNIFKKATDRKSDITKKINDLQKKIDAVQKLKDETGTGDVDEAKAKTHGIEDKAGGAGIDKDDVDHHLNDLTSKKDAHTDEVKAAEQEAADSLKQIRETGVGGKMEATFMTLTSTMKDPNAGIGEKLAAVLVAFSELQSTFTDITGKALGDASKGGAEASPSSPAGKRESVKKMMKDAQEKDSNVTDLTKLKAVKQKELDNGGVPPGKKQLAEVARTKLAASNSSLATAKNEMTAANATDPKDQSRIDTATAAVTGLQTTVTAFEEAVKTAEAAVKAVEADIKAIDEVKNDGDKRVDTYNQGIMKILGELRNASNKLPADSQEKKDVDLIDDVLTTADFAEKAANGIDIEFKLDGAKQLKAFQAFSRVGIDSTKFEIDRNDVIGNPDAFLTAIEQLIKKVSTKAKK